MLKAIFFDLDGTLLDTVEDIRACLNGALGAFGFPPLSPERTKACIGDGARRLVMRALPAEGKEALDACYAEFSARYAASDGGLIRPYAGVKEMLLGQAARGRKLAVITNKPQAALEVCLKRFFPEVPFAYAAGETGAFPPKPDPTLTRYAALTLRVAPSECVFVGDGETDVRTAKNAGMRGISALWGYRSREQLAAAGASEFARDCAELVKFLENA